MNKQNGHNRMPSEEGRKILYRLLLMAVAVVYALVFILDYLLQLHFTFFLLLSLFGFVIMTLLYMWFRVSSDKDRKTMDDAANADEETKVKSASYSEDVFDDVILIINPRNGLTIDCSAAAVDFMQAAQKGQLLGIDLSVMFDESWSAADRMQLKKELDEHGKAAASVKLKTFSGTAVYCHLEAVRFNSEGEELISIRIKESKQPEPVRPAQLKGTDDQWYYPTVVIGINYKFLKANKAFCDLSGFTEEELRHRQFVDLALVEERQNERKFLSDLFSGRIDHIRTEKRIVKRNNEVIWIQTNASIVREASGHPKYVVLMAENITQRKKIEKTMADDSSRLSAFIENAEYAVLSVDIHHTILVINSKLSDQLFALTGIVVEKGFHLLDILPEIYHKEYVSIHGRAFSGEHVTVERSLNVNGNKIIAEIIVTPVKDLSGKVKSISIFGQDVTQRKRAEEELVRSRDEAEAATQAKSGFLATMSHEIRTPLNGVIGMGRLLSQTPLTPKQQEFVDSILLSGEALLSVINDILDYSKIESSKMELEHKPFALKRCIEETFDLLSSKALEKKLSLHYLIARNVPAYIYGDITRLRQVLMNLVSNAIKFTTKGAITIRVTMDAIDGDTIRLHFSVQDTGVGIPVDKIGKLFKAFAQADASTAKTYGGTGLGLAICKNLVDLMGGRIWVESQEGKGSDFQFTIRTEAVPEADIPKTGVHGTNRLANSYVLIISDDKLEADVYANYFRRWGMIPQQAADIKSALQLVKDRSDLNLVLIDAQMTSVKAMDLAREIRVSRSKESLPLVLFNADRGGDMFFDYTNEIVSAVIPQNVDRSKVLDILIGVFSVENHSRIQHEEKIRSGGKKLGEELPVRILIAEDNHINQKLAQNIFDGLGYKPVIVSNGLQVIDKLKDQTFDLIFMDVQMPEMDGLEATRFITHKMDLVKRPAIVAMTAFALEGDKEKCMEAGMDDYISKPFLVEEIIDKIKKWGTTNSGKAMTSNASAASGTNSTELLNRAMIDRLKEMTSAGDPEFFGQVIRMFIEQAEEIITDLTMNAQSDAVLLAAQAHKLKGSALNMGASAIAEICRRLEIKGKEKDLEKIGEELKELSQAFIRTKAELKALIAG